QILLVRKLRCETTRMRATLGREPTTLELRLELGLSKIGFATTARAVATLESPMAGVAAHDDEGGIAVIDNAAVDPCDAAHERARLEWLNVWLDRLKPRTRAIIRMRFG